MHIPISSNTGLGPTTRTLPPLISATWKMKEASSLTLFFLLAFATHGHIHGGASPSWDLYRLGDVVKHHGVPKKWQPPSTSIAAEYLRRTELENDFDVLATIVRERRATVVPPPPGTVVVHLRLGDTADLYDTTTLWKEGSPVKRMTNNASGVVLEVTGFEVAPRPSTPHPPTHLIPSFTLAPSPARTTTSSS